MNYFNSILRINSLIAMDANDQERGNGWLTYFDAAALQSRASRCENCSTFARPVSLQISSCISCVGILSQADLLMTGGQD